LISADEAMSRYAQGDDAAFDAVYEDVAPRLTRYLRRHVREKTRMEDILQQTFLQMHAARGTFILGAEVVPWAFAIARRLVIDASRSRKREELLAVDDEDLSDRGGIAMAVASSEELVQAQQAGERLAAAYERLTEPQRTAFELVKIDGLPYAQAAAVLGTTVSGIKLRVYRVHSALRGALGLAESLAAEETSGARLVAAKEL
jgi:RNA polymerase sigma-70 factor, ECF subfamily